ncbi:MAG: hypothetical protein ACR2MS_07660 [Weeksellaceae bacterium]
MKLVKLVEIDDHEEWSLFIDNQKVASREYFDGVTPEHLKDVIQASICRKASTGWILFNEATGQIEEYE